MLIEIISESTVKVTLSKSDMEDYAVSYEELDRKNPETRQLLLELIDIIEEEKSLDLCAEKLFVEAFPQSDGGCLLYISIIDSNLKRKNNLYNEIVCTVPDTESLIALCKQLYQFYCHLFRKSELYRDSDSFRLIIHTFSKSDRKIRMLLSEYGTILGASPVLSELTREHGELILEDNAVERLSTLNP